MARRRSSQQALTAIGWRECPKCVKDGRIDHRFDCDLCWDEEDKRFNRRVPVDVYIRYIQDQARLEMGYKDTAPEMPSVREEKKK